jgi:hypothetical protein
VPHHEASLGDEKCVAVLGKGKLRGFGGVAREIRSYLPALHAALHDNVPFRR